MSVRAAAHVPATKADGPPAGRQAGDAADSQEQHDRDVPTAKAPTSGRRHHLEAAGAVEVGEQRRRRCRPGRRGAACR